MCYLHFSFCQDFFLSRLEKMRRTLVCNWIRMNCQYRFPKGESAAPGFEALRIPRIRVNPHLLDSHFVQIRLKICWIRESSESRIRWIRKSANPSNPGFAGFAFLRIPDSRIRESKISWIRKFGFIWLRMGFVARIPGFAKLWPVPIACDFLG